MECAEYQILAKSCSVLMGKTKIKSGQEISEVNFTFWTLIISRINALKRP